MLPVYDMQGHQILTFQIANLIADFSSLEKQLEELNLNSMYVHYVNQQNQIFRPTQSQNIETIKFALLSEDYRTERLLEPIKIYARKGDKKGMILNVHLYTVFQELAIQIEKKLKLPKQAQQLYYQSEKIVDLTETLKLRSVKPNQVIHVIDLRTIPEDLESEFTINLQKAKKDSEIKQIIVRGNLKLSDMKPLALEVFDSLTNDIIFAYRGKLIHNWDSTIFQNRIGEGVTVNVLDLRDAINQIEADQLRKKHRQLQLAKGNYIQNKRQEVQTIKKEISLESKELQITTNNKEQEIEQENAIISRNLQKIQQNVVKNIINNENTLNQNQKNAQLQQIHQQRQQQQTNANYYQIQQQITVPTVIPSTQQQYQQQRKIYVQEIPQYVRETIQEKDTAVQPYLSYEEMVISSQQTRNFNYEDEVGIISNEKQQQQRKIYLQQNNELNNAKNQINNEQIIADNIGVEEKIGQLIEKKQQEQQQEQKVQQKQQQQQLTPENIQQQQQNNISSNNQVNYQYHNNQYNYQNVTTSIPVHNYYSNQISQHNKQITQHQDPISKDDQNLLVEIRDVQQQNKVEQQKQQYNQDGDQKPVENEANEDNYQNKIQNKEYYGNYYENEGNEGSKYNEEKSEQNKYVEGSNKNKNQEIAENYDSQHIYTKTQEQVQYKQDIIESQQQNIVDQIQSQSQNLVVVGSQQQQISQQQVQLVSQQAFVQKQINISELLQNAPSQNQIAEEPQQPVKQVQIQSSQTNNIENLLDSYPEKKNIIDDLGSAKNDEEYENIYLNKRVPQPIQKTSSTKINYSSQIQQINNNINNQIPQHHQQQTETLAQQLTGGQYYQYGQQLEQANQQIEREKYTEQIVNSSVQNPQNLVVIQDQQQNNNNDDLLLEDTPYNNRKATQNIKNQFQQQNLLNNDNEDKLIKPPNIDSNANQEELLQFGQTGYSGIASNPDSLLLENTTEDVKPAVVNENFLQPIPSQQQQQLNAMQSQEKKINKQNDEFIQNYLKEEDLIPSEIHIPKEATIKTTYYEENLLDSIEEPNKSPLFTLNFKDMNYNSYTLEVTEQELVSSIKQRLRSTYEIHQGFNLLEMGQTLQDQLTLKAHGINSESSIFIMMVDDEQSDLI